jgi:5-methylcytosine-specific restriction endonuclease McrA
VATIDHIVPLARGGTNYEGNLTPACRPCNSSKGTLLLVEWRKRLATVERKAA